MGLHNLDIGYDLLRALEIPVDVGHASLQLDMHCPQRLYRIIERYSDFLLLVSGFRACLDRTVLWA